MTFLESLIPYTDGNGLICPSPVGPGVKRGSDNGPLYTSQALILNGAIDVALLDAVEQCVDLSGSIHRTPDDVSADSPDDYYGVLSVGVIYGSFSIHIPDDMKFQFVLDYLNILNNAIIYHPIAWLLAPFVAIIVAFSNVFTDKNDTSNRMLTWTFCQALKRTWLPRYAALFWEWRQRRIYGSIQNLFAEYFSPNHPFITQVKDYYEH